MKAKDLTEEMIMFGVSLKVQELIVAVVAGKVTDKDGNMASAPETFAIMLMGMSKEDQDKIDSLVQQLADIADNAIKKALSSNTSKLI